MKGRLTDDQLLSHALDLVIGDEFGPAFLVRAQ